MARKHASHSIDIHVQYQTTETAKMQSCLRFKYLFKWLLFTVFFLFSAFNLIAFELAAEEKIFEYTPRCSINLAGRLNCSPHIEALIVIRADSWAHFIDSYQFYQIFVGKRAGLRTASCFLEFAVPVSFIVSCNKSPISTCQMRLVSPKPFTIQRSFEKFLKNARYNYLCIIMVFIVG